MAKKQQTVHQIKILGLNDIKALNVEISKLAGNYDELKGAADDAKKPLKDTGKDAGGAATGIARLAKGAAAAGVALFAFQKVSKSVAKELQKGFKVFKDYEFQMAKVKAISGANTEEFTKLDKSAQALGRSTFFTAEQVAGLQLNFSKLGFTSKEILKVQEGALLSATATGEDLARTATVIGSTIRGFGLDASEATRVSDVMAASFSSSALTLEKFQTAMTKVAPVAKILGLSLEETTATLGVLTDAGIEASIAGTSLRNIFLKLGDPSSDLAKSIGFTVNSGEDMVREFKRMRDEGVNVERMLKLVDVRQVAAISTMIQNVDMLEKQIAAYNDAEGAADMMARKIEDSVNGALLKFNSALDGLRIFIFEKFAPAMQSTLEFFADLANTVPKVITLMTTFKDISVTPIADELEKDRIAMNNLFDTLKKTNISADTRKKLIKQINTEYIDYLPNILTEKDNLESLEIAQKNANKAYQDKITLIAAEEKFADVRKRQIENEVEALDLQVKLTEQEKQLLAVEESKSLLAAENRRQGDETLLTRGQISANIVKTNQAITDNATAADDLAKEYDKVALAAKNLGLNLDNLSGKKGQNGNEGGLGATIINAERLKNDALLFIKQQFAQDTKELKLEDDVSQLISAEDLAAQLEDIERQYFTNRLANLEVGSDEYMALKAQQAQFELQLELDLLKEKKKVFESERQAKESLELAKIQAVAKGASIIGSLAEEGSALAKAAFIVEQGAAVANVIVKGQQELAALRLGMSVQNGLLFGSGTAMYTPLIAQAKIGTAMSVASILAQTISGFGGGSDETAEGGGGVSTSQDIKFEQGGLTRGGMFQGNSHANGGVKFRVGGRIHEAEGGEAIINKRSTSMFRPVLSAINSYNGNGVKFADGGLLNSGEKFAMGGELRSAQQLVSGGTGSSKVVIVESDMTEVQNRISAIESQATF